MVWFQCEDCGDSIKKPKLQAHTSRCSAYRLTCIDCNSTFDQQGARSHNQCVTEHQKYAEGATKPGGIAANGFKANDTIQETTGGEYLSTKSPWTCRLCNVTCTSQETLSGHATGTKHKKRAKAAEAAKCPSSDATKAADATNAPEEKSDKCMEGSAKKDETLCGTGEKRKRDPKAVDGNKTKWKKLAAEVLTGGEQLSIKKLQKTLIKKAGAEDSEEMREKILSRLKSSSKFTIEGKTISLSS